MEDKTYGEPTLPSGRYQFRYIYKADEPNYPVSTGGGWRPSIYMPKEAARIFLRVKDVRVERLHDINDEQARAEGARPVMISTDPEGTPTNTANGMIWEIRN